MYRVGVASDGCGNWWVDHPDAQGSRDQCVDFMARHNPPRGYDIYFDLVNLETGRCESYALPFAGRKHRLVEQDLISR